MLLALRILSQSSNSPYRLSLFHFSHMVKQIHICEINLTDINKY